MWEHHPRPTRRQAEDTQQTPPNAEPAAAPTSGQPWPLQSSFGFNHVARADELLVTSSRLVCWIALSRVHPPRPQRRILPKFAIGALPKDTYRNNERKSASRPPRAMGAATWPLQQSSSACLPACLPVCLSVCIHA